MEQISPLTRWLRNFYSRLKKILKLRRLFLASVVLEIKTYNYFV